MPSTNRIYGGEKIFLTPEERAEMLRGASDQFMTDITYLPRYLQEYIAQPAPLTPGELRNPQRGTIENLRAENRQWDEFQQGQPAAYQQGRPYGTAGALAADPLNYMAQAVPVVKGAGRLASMVAREAATPQGLRTMTNALTNQRGAINFYRNTRTKDTPDTGMGFTMWADKPDGLEIYGKNKWEMDGEGLPSINDFSDAVKEKYLKDLENYKLPSDLEDIPPETIFNEMNPEYIVNNAGTWDNPSFVEWFYNNFGDDIKGVRTNDGAILFDQSLARKRK